MLPQQRDELIVHLIFFSKSLHQLKSAVPQISYLMCVYTKVSISKKPNLDIRELRKN